MKSRLLLLTILVLLTYKPVKAQKTYTDFKPNYMVWNTRYILDKIEYTPQSTIFHFRYLARPFSASSMSLYGVGHKEAWALVNIENETQVFKMKMLKNIKRNGKLIHHNFKLTQQSFRLSPKDVYTCEVHFPRIPKNITKVHFLEGVYSAKNRFHFHCLNVVLKHNQKQLGTEKDMQNRITRFEERVWGPPKSIVILKTKKVEEAQAEMLE